MHKGKVMAKKKYLYQDKKFLSGRNLESEDLVSYISPMLAKKISQNFLSDTAFMKKTFELYFDSFREFGISTLLNPKKVRGDIDQLLICSADGLGILERSTAAATFPDKTVFIRGNNKAGDYAVLFHELNHVLSFHNYSNKDATYDERGPLQTNSAINSKSGFNTFYVDGDSEFLLFNEGVTEYLALRQSAFASKKEVVVGAYDNEVAFARMLYLIAGNALFDGYFNGGNFDAVNAGIGIEGFSKEDLKSFADIVSLIDEQEDAQDHLDVFCCAYEAIISILGLKVEKEICENFDKFKNPDEIVGSVTKAYANFAKAIYFGGTKLNYGNAIRGEVFDLLCSSYVETLSAIETRFYEEGQHLKFNQNLKLDQSEIEDACGLFEFVNLRNYGIITKDEKPITVDNLLEQENIVVLKQGKADYIRKKMKMDDPVEMRAFGESFLQ